MSIERHGLSVGIERVGEDFFLTLKAVGKLTHEDYKQITPLLESALDGLEEPRGLVFVDATHMEGWELRAAWDDFKLGMAHGKKFKKVAIWGNKNWQEMAAKIGGWFVSGDVKFFTYHDDALNWLLSDD
ncbi:hypothetical protein HMF8227_01287 [Saliniradius amylolyticus]|uniref:STAS/SEC14 domain-containing protein n=1 Tax=Saliniradius amylolyticus TaxID=2183582 RepID=A0A2S2E291_9ALTE|nr:STAS/SEC14 domain-containing protein [Saliniradius amylolyticus]AWL11765.1 hypothetical protein HMF8227_01287 [Saliniradius amylolyticus]